MASWVGQAIAERRLDGSNDRAGARLLRLGRPTCAHEGDYECLTCLGSSALISLGNL